MRTLLHQSPFRPAHSLGSQNLGSKEKTQIFDAFIEVGSGPDMAKVDGSKTLHAAGVFKPDVKTPFLDKDSRMIYCLCADVIVFLPDVRYLSSGSA